MKFGEHMQNLADGFAITASLLAAVTSLSVWTALTGSPGWTAQLLVSSAALLAAVVVAFPQIRRYGETGGKARELATQYGQLVGAPHRRRRRCRSTWYRGWRPPGDSRLRGGQGSQGPAAPLPQGCSAGA